ncbi:MAG TPA: energy transducer TonB [Gemmatimonadaceae bacterium]|nr:energy transducer TonB [Gemmatimonadaceae bacterium]
MPTSVIRIVALGCALLPAALARVAGAQSLDDLRACPEARPDTVRAVVVVRVSTASDERRVETFGTSFASAVARALRLPDGTPTQALRQGAGSGRRPSLLVGIRAQYDLRLDEGTAPVLSRRPGDPAAPALDAAMRTAVTTAADAPRLAALRKEGWTTDTPLRLLVATVAEARPGAAPVDTVDALRYTIDRPAAPPTRPRPPVYPPELREAGVEGEAVLEFVIGADGTVRDGSVTVVRATAHQFATAAAVALNAMRYRPASIRGCAIPTLVRQPFQFSLRTGLGTPRAQKRP